jgi:CRP/FNR family cyclic AMP-dependent transcriptional regulator
MISPELIRRYPAFSGLTMEEVTILARAAQQVDVEEGHWFFREGEQLNVMYLVVEGSVGIMVELPRQEVLTTTVGPGEIFAWSGLLPPYETTAGAKALSRCQVVQFDCQPIRAAFESDCHFGYVMMERVAQVVRQRLRNLRTEALPCYTS